MVTLHCLELVIAGVSSVTIHNEGDMLRNGPAFQAADQELAELLHTEFDRREG